MNRWRSRKLYRSAVGWWECGCWDGLNGKGAHWRDHIWWEAPANGAAMSIAYHAGVAAGANGPVDRKRLPLKVWVKVLAEAQR